MIKKFNLFKSFESILDISKIDPTEIDHLFTPTLSSKWSESVMDLLDDLDCKSCLSFLSEDNSVFATVQWDWNNSFQLDEMAEMVNDIWYGHNDDVVHFSVETPTVLIGGVSKNIDGVKSVSDVRYINAKVTRSILIEIDGTNWKDMKEEESDFKVDNKIDVNYFIKMSDQISKLSSVFKRCKSLSNEIDIMEYSDYRASSWRGSQYFLIVFK